MTFDTTQTTFLHDLLSTPSPSGFEGQAARRWREEAETFAAIVDHDVSGNSWASNRSAGGLHIVIEGHIDEIGFIVTWIDDNGFIWIDRIGGWDDQVVVGQRIVIVGRDGPVHGVIGKKATHLLKPADREKVTALSDVWIDIGAKDKADAERRV
ncbi:MAG TPA: M42 family peptidase, partial [Thermomicrobiales bacterium]|nr:M42 family peptidase [Thermomicrobiales bacterium]